MISVISNRQGEMEYPHYSDSRFSGEHLVFDDGTGLGGGWDYSDRFPFWGFDKYSEAWAKAVGSSFSTSQPAFWDLFLTEYFQCPATTHQIAASVNPSDGHPIWALKYSKQER